MPEISGIPFPADTIVHSWVSGINSLFQECIQGIYLTGSIPLRDFQPQKSDIDFVVVLSYFPDQLKIEGLEAIHIALQRQRRKPDLSGIYVTQEILYSQKPDRRNVLHYTQGELSFKPFEMAPITIFELKYSSLTLIGPPGLSLPIEFSRTELNSFLYTNIHTYWVKWIRSHSGNRSKMILLFLFPRFTEWSVLGMARLLFTLETYKIVSKMEAGRYVLGRIPDQYKGIVTEAMDIRRDNRIYPLLRTYAIRPSIRRYRETLNCLRYLLHRFDEVYYSDISTL
jgi:hypothetical protein